MQKRHFFIIIAFSSLILTQAQVTFPTNGAPHNAHTIYAYINANIYVDHETLIKNGVLMYKNDKIISVSDKVDIPKDAKVIDLKGKYIYPAFIDIYSDYGLTDNKFLPRSVQGPQMESSVKGAYGWNQAIRPENESYKNFIHNKEKADTYKKLGFSTVLTCSKDGIVRGSGALVNLNNNSKENLSIVSDKCAAFYSLNKGSSTQDYPSSLTGCIALLRQTYCDAIWYKNNSNKIEYNISLEAFNKLQELPSIIEGNDKFTDIRISKIAKEFKLNYIVKAGGNEYQRIYEIQNTGLKYILPLNFPDVIDVEDAYDTENVPLSDLKHWELAPTNPAEFEKNNIPFCFTLSDLKNKDDFYTNLKKAVQYGLSEKSALKALTTNPAQFINASNKIGALKKGYCANFFISNKSIFADDASVLMTVTNGEQELFSDLEPIDFRGNYNLALETKNYDFKFFGDVVKPSAEIKIDTGKKTINYQIINNIISFTFHYDSINIARLTGNYDLKNRGFFGKGQWANGNWFNFNLNYISPIDTSSKKATTVKKPVLNLGKVIYPFSAYGQSIPTFTGTFKENWNKSKQLFGALLIKNATVWTNEKDSVLNETDVYISGGKIIKIGKNIEVAKTMSVQIINGKGMHLTAGIIDEHSHIALSQGVNEGAQASSAEVRMGDVINSDDINIYRQLAGGVTSAQLLHGSANPIGGQSGIIKLRWGHAPEDMKYENADEFIKFALGENVKQSNWGDQASVRFPQSRMGVEQVYFDYFSRAKEYDKEWNNYSKTNSKDSKVISPRKDLELEALAEIINKKRFITCHSYVQSEINMLMHVADSFGFKINTFTHILEGYKVADKMKAHGVYASSFSDWWAYKNEVMEAIPYNAAILTKMGVITAINSDDAEMGRRLNQEAAKSIKYGGLSEVEALKLVTLNPAKMLHLDDKVGSIKVGKVADLVLWTENPLSIYAKVDKTIIDGQIYFDLTEDKKLQENIKTERARIIAELLKLKQNGAKTVKHKPRGRRLYHCNTLEGVEETETGHR